MPPLRLHGVVLNTVKLYRYFIEIIVGWVPCHHGMARPQVADGGQASSY